jgi:hypothetical protein
MQMEESTKKIARPRQVRFEFPTAHEFPSRQHLAAVQPLCEANLDDAFTPLGGYMQRYMGEMDRKRTDIGENGKADEKTNGYREVMRTTSTRAAAAMRA